MAICSILVPAYNGEKYLRRALDSAINQTYKDFEIVLINDGSKDTTPQICDEYARKYEFVRVFHQENRGITRTCERLLELSLGKYIFWLYQDDYLDETLLEKAVSVFEREKADIVAWGRVDLSADGIRMYDPIQEMGFETWRHTLSWGIQPGLMMFATQKDLWRKREPFPDDVNLTHDAWSTPQLIKAAKKIATISDFLYYYETHNFDSITHSPSAKTLFEDGLTYYRIVKQVLEKQANKVPPQFILTLIRKFFVDAYCLNQVQHHLNAHQVDLIRFGLNDLIKRFPQKKLKKFYCIQLCVINGFDFICRWYGKGRIRKFERINK